MLDTKPTKIHFTPYHRPALESGEYQLSVAQSLQIDSVEKIAPNITQTFYVSGERFHILPEHIHSAFPPAHSLGDHSNVLPHLMLARTTLPWERESITGDPNTPWLALLVIHEDETSQAVEHTVALGNFTTSSNTSPFFPEITPEPGQTPTDKLKVLDIEKGLLEAILPSAEELSWLTHARQGKDDDGNMVGEEMAVLVANRLPQKGAVNTVYLVSLEDRYKADNGTFNFQSAVEQDKIRLINLYSWTFTSTEHFKVSESFLEKASDLDGKIIEKLTQLKGREFFTELAFKTALIDDAGFTQEELDANKDFIFKDFSFGDFAQILKHLDRSSSSLCLPEIDTLSDKENSFLRSGFYPLPHTLRGGSSTVSWYHGPLSPKSNEESESLPAKGSDALLRYYESNSIFDVSYAAAWELGRLLALQNAHFSTNLYHWKRGYACSQHRAAQCEDHDASHLQGGHQDHSSEPFPEELRNWLRDLEYLQGVPFNYLVPDERLLPAESIRFFQLDQRWVRCLLDGALSIGRVTSSDHALDDEISAVEDLLKTRPISGFILRSEVVSGWPGMQIEAFDDLPEENKLTLLRKAYLSKNVLLCLFEGDLATLDLHLKPEVLHFGFDSKETTGVDAYEKKLRDTSGEELGTVKIDIPFKSNSTYPNVLNLINLTKTISSTYDENSGIVWNQSPTAADLALQLLEGVERVRFRET
jgi:hypothetical protein